MNSYSYIEAFFKSILGQSLQIQGRLIVCPRGGSEVNNDEYSQIMELVTSKPKLPACFMMPPRSSGIFGKMDEWEDYTFIFFFLNTTFYNDAGQVSKINAGTQTSGKKVTEEWEEMKQAAVDFLRVVQLVQKGNNSESIIMLNNLFRLSNERKYIDPVSFVGTARLSGVKVTFKASVFTSCNIETYQSGGVVLLPDSNAGGITYAFTTNQSFQLHSDGVYVLADGFSIDMFKIKPSSSSTIKIGSTPGGNDLMPDELLQANKWKTVNVDIDADGEAVTVYFTGILTTADIIVYRRNR